MDTLPLKQIIEGAIFAAERPLTVEQLVQIFEGDIPERSEIRAALKELAQDCEARGFELKQVASGYRFQVKSEYGEWISRLWKEKPPRYTRALLETLALVAYKQPITRGDIEEIRGVAVSTNIMRTLLEREWVRVVGHRDVPGHPALYATTKSFLDYFNLRNLDELPALADIKDLAQLNPELEMEEELIEIRTLEINEEDQEVIAGIEDADLDAVSAQVDTIQENIRSMLKADEETEEDDGEFDDDVIPPAPKTATVTPISGAAPQATPETETQAADESGENAGADSSTHEKEGDF
jgi:segregation and condensation protein B